MVQRRLNRKVALIGFAVVALLLLLIISAILHLGQDPKEFIRDAEVALKAAREATDAQIKEQNYQRAGHSFREAFDRAGTDSLREDILLKMLDMYSETGEWNYILRCWEGLIKVNPNNAKARYGRLQYSYSLADSGDHGFWPQVQEQASEFLKVAQDADLLDEETAQWNVPGLERKVTGPQLLGPQLYLLRARAAFEMARLGAVTDQDKVLEQAVADLKKVQELEPGSIDAYWYLSQAAVTRGEIFASRGDFEERDKASSQAVALLEQGVEIAGDSPRAHINLLTLKLTLAGTGTAEMLKERIQSIEPEYLSLIERFGSSAEAFAAVSNFYGVYSIYSGPLLGAGNLDRAIETAEQAANLDKGNVAHVLDLANFHYRKYCLYESEPDANKAIEIAKAALALPDAQDTPGPRRQANRNNRYNLYALLANCYIEQILETSQPAAESKTREWTAGAEQAVHEIEQLVGSGEDPRVRRWQGMLELAKGNEETAVNELYAAYKQIKSIKPPEPPWPPDPEFAQLSYTLATIFKGTPEIGAAHEFLISALLSRIGWIRPDASLDYVDVLLKFGHYSDAIQNIDAYEGRSGSNKRSQELRIKAHIGAQQFAEAEAELAKRPGNEPDTIKLRLELIRARIRHIQLAIAQKKTQETSAPAPRQTTPDSADSQVGTEQFMTEELKNYTQLEADLLEKLLPTGLDYSEQLSVINACRTYIMQGQTALAGRLIDRFLEHFPDNAAALVYKQILSEPAPLEVSQQRRREIESQALSSIADPTRKAVQLGVYHHRYNELDKAIEYLKGALDTAFPSQGQISDRLTLEQLQLAASHLLDIAAEKKDWELAEQVAEKARQGNLDSCRGQVFATRLAMAKGDLKDALARVDDCLKQKPIFSYAYMLRSQINAAMGNEHASMEDINRAASMNPLDGTVARGLAAMLYRRNQKLGGNVSAAQVTEARDALEKAVALNPRDLALLGLYADYIAPIE
ncbi:MAG: tetratricopeptide repeat protein, partial [Planctomycetota bacterium]